MNSMTGLMAVVVLLVAVVILRIGVIEHQLQRSVKSVNVIP